MTVSIHTSQPRKPLVDLLPLPYSPAHPLLQRSHLHPLCRYPTHKHRSTLAVNTRLRPLLAVNLVLNLLPFPTVSSSWIAFSCLTTNGCAHTVLRNSSNPPSGRSGNACSTPARIISRYAAAGSTLCPLNVETCSNVSSAVNTLRNLCCPRSETLMCSSGWTTTCDRGAPAAGRSAPE